TVRRSRRSSVPDERRRRFLTTLDCMTLTDTDADAGSPGRESTVSDTLQRELRTPAVAGLAGLVFAALVVLSLRLLYRQPAGRSGVHDRLLDDRPADADTSTLGRVRRLRRRARASLQRFLLPRDGLRVPGVGDDRERRAARAGTAGERRAALRPAGMTRRQGV